jgi:peptide/nickel transport system substrate-binding protein
VTAAVFFGGDQANPDTYTKFWCDMQMYTTTMTQPDPQLFMEQYCSLGDGAEGEQVGQAQHPALEERRVRQGPPPAQSELDPVKRAALFIRMNDLIGASNHIIPVVFRPRVSAASTKLSAPLSGWDNDMWALPHWFKEA